ncbi:hypothetical protein C4544_03905 [candidate division WS5 bacterium]|uniref:Uncharacterized protein n=1 Tax=candidate division WS5 bacterium TaxID=2093353 RepID=A0A419DDA2_9BACT|nr:MAG: hypothetical protein C4544_03905 [candidate division WS5 bacterium]
MSDYDEFIKEFSSASPFEVFYDKGIKPEEIKAAIIETFDPYFENKDRLEEYSTIWLITGWVIFMKFKQNKWHLDKFDKCLAYLNQAKKQNLPCHSVLADWLPEINQSVSRFWSFHNLAQDLDQLDDHEFLEESLKLIGQVLEGITKSYLKLFLHISRLSRGMHVTKEEINNLDLGKIVDELINNTNFSDLFSPPPWGIKLSQWRNIAYHHNAKLEANHFVCWYGKEPNIKTFVISRDDLLDAVRCIVNIYNTFKTVEVVFVFDNLPECQDELKKRGDYKDLLREEVKILELFTGINSQGFKIVAFNKDDHCSKLTIQDLTDRDITKRAVHSSQFLYSLWLYTSSHEVSIEYRLKNGKPFLTSSTNKIICEKIASNEKGIDYLAEKVEFNFFTDNK